LDNSLRILRVSGTLKFIQRWEQGLVFGLCLATAFLGIGRLEIFPAGGSISAWSISRTTFFFWLALKIVLVIRNGWSASRVPDLAYLWPIFLFFGVVTISLLPDFRQAGDYRYFFFGCVHTVMLVDLFTTERRQRWLPALLGLVPLVLVVRGIVHDPSILKLDLAHRFSFPLDSWNTAGYVFAMSMPFSAFLAITTAGTPRIVGVVAGLAQMLALLLTFSRGAWLGWIAALAYFGIATRKFHYLALLLVLAGGGMVVAPALLQRLASVTEPEIDHSILGRMQLFKSSLAVGIDNPLLGIGYGRGRLKEELRPRLQGTVLEGKPIWHSHNLYIELFAGTGILGLGTFLFLSVRTMLDVNRAALLSDGPRRILGFAIAASWLAALVAGVGDIPFYHHETRIFFFTLAGMAHIYYSSVLGVVGLAGKELPD
jgi:O-antigen ligase